MKSKMLMIVSTVLVCFILFSTCGLSGYVINDDSSKFTYIASYDGEINHGLLSTNVKASIEGKSTVTSVKIKMELQKLSDGSYSTIETWEQTFSGRSGSMDESKLTSPLNTYRLKATVTAYSGSNSESKEFYAY